MRLEVIERELATFQAQAFCNGVAPLTIDSAAATIGLPFPRGYREFLATLGCGYVSFHEFIGLGGPDHLDVVKETLWLRDASTISTFPRSFIPILSDGFGNYECIDTSRRTSGDEFKVVNWLHDGGNDQRCEELADSYLQWFWSVLQMIRRVDAEDG